MEKTRRDKERKAERDALKARAKKEEELRLEHLMVHATCPRAYRTRVFRSASACIAHPARVPHGTLVPSPMLSSRLRQVEYTQIGLYRDHRSSSPCMGKPSSSATKGYNAKLTGMSGLNGCNGGANGSYSRGHGCNGANGNGVCSACGGGGASSVSSSPMGMRGPGRATGYGQDALSVSPECVGTPNRRHSSPRRNGGSTARQRVANGHGTPARGGGGGGESERSR